MSSRDGILKEDNDWYEKFHKMPIDGNCDSGCGKLAKSWFGNSSRATCGDAFCIEQQEEEYKDLCTEMQQRRETEEG